MPGKYLEFSFIRNSLFNNNCTDEVLEYINQVRQSIKENSRIDRFVSAIMDIAMAELKSRNCIAAAYLFDLIHNFYRDSNSFDENQFYNYDFFSFYEHMIDEQRLDILKNVIFEIAINLIEQNTDKS